MGRDARILDPTPCLVRHVRRAAAGETSTTVLQAAFHAAAGPELDALNGRAGWQSANVAQALSDDGSVVLVLANAEGDDGRRHRERFGLLTDDTYRIGEEWLEVYRGEQMRPDDLEAVFTPAAWRMDRGNLELRGPDLMALYTLARSSELDVWHHAPRDVFEHYTRLPVALLARSFANWIATGSGASSDGWTYADAASPGALPGIRLADAGGAPASVAHAIAGAEADNFAAAARITWELPAPPTAVGQDVRLVVAQANGDTIEARYSPFDGNLQLAGAAIAVGAGVMAAAGKTKRTMPGGCSLKLLVRRRWVYAYLEGELLARARRSALSAPVSVAVEARNATVTVNRIDAEDLKPFGLRGADKGDRRLPGIPTPGGLRGRYYNEAAAASQLPGGAAGAPYLQAVLDDLRDPNDSRLDPVLSFALGAAWQPPAAQPASGAFSARWTGAIYLDLTGNGRRVRLGILDGAARVWIGRTLLDADAVIDSWTAGSKADLRSARLETLLGSASGWFPIVVEYANDGGNGSITLQESPLDGSGNPTAWADVPATKLSPLGCYEETHRFESHRELLGTIAETFGYQWRVDPRKLESGEFPGQVIPRIRVGVDTDKIVPNDRATDLASEGDAADAVDRLLVDAAGIADPKGAEQLTASVVNDPAVNAPGGHLFLSTGAESLPEVTEPNLLEQRASSLLALRSGPNEQVAARPTDAAQELTDTFPLTGALARRRWRPGDGLRLALEDLSVVDDTPRQLLAISWPLYRQGAGAPSVGWRQRPRGLRAFLRRIARVSFAAQRNYQGQSGVITGTFGATAGAADGYSRAPLPEDLSRVVEATLVVEAITGPTGTVEINGAATAPPVLVNSVGRYDVTRFIARDGVAPRMRARITGATTYEIHLELRVNL